jgi:diguanylate cyclase (GGDEF)-like protein/PAS domain S-box-containing protein
VETLSIDLEKLDDSFLAIWVLNEKKCFVNLNKKAEELLGYKKEELIGKSISSIRPKYFKNDYVSKSWEAIERHGYWAGPALNRHKNGELVSMERIVVKKISEDNKINYISLSSEISHSATKDEIEGTLIETDTVTGFIVKHLFIDTLEKINKKNKRKNKKTALISIDTDKSIVVRESLGYEARDEYIKEVAKRIAHVLDKYGFISRFTDDHFNVILFDYGSHKFLLKVLQQLVDEFRNPMIIFEKEINASVNIGVCFYPDNGSTTEEMLKNVSIAKTLARKDGGNCFRFFEQNLNKEFVNQLFLENELRKALKNNEFELYFQPQYLVSEKRVSGFEGLIRWIHPEKGLITPDHFIPFAEENGLIVEIGKWVIKQAIHQIKKWQEKGYEFELDINLSAKDLLHDELVDYIKNLLVETKINPKFFGIEITETAMINNVVKVSENVKKLEKLGILVGIDDFGTGHSSLSHLIDIPFDFIKIDRSFLFDIKSKKNKAIINLSLSLAKELGLLVVAEGVETEEHIEFLKEQGCHYLQGYYFSKPVPLSQIEKDIEKYINIWE